MLYYWLRLPLLKYLEVFVVLVVLKSLELLLRHLMGLLTHLEVLDKLFLFGFQLLYSNGLLLIDHGQVTDLIVCNSSNILHLFLKTLNLAYVELHSLLKPVLYLEDFVLVSLL